MTERKVSEQQGAVIRQGLTLGDQLLDQHIRDMAKAVETEGYRDALIGQIGTLALRPADSLAILAALAIGRLASDRAEH